MATATDNDLALVASVAPIIAFDRCEPFEPLKVGVTVFHRPGNSRADYRRTLSGESPLEFDGVDAVVE